MTEVRSNGYGEGYQDGWNAAMDSKAPQAQQPAVEHVAEMSHKFGRPVLLPRAPMLDDKQPLYTSPPPPADVPLLTEQKMYDLYQEAMHGSFVDSPHYWWRYDKARKYAKAIEQAVRQKAGLK